MPTIDNRHGYAVMATRFDDPEIKVSLSESCPSWRQRDKVTPWVNVAIKGVVTLHITPDSAAELVELISAALVQVSEQYGWQRTNVVPEPDQADDLDTWDTTWERIEPEPLVLR